MLQAVKRPRLLLVDQQPFELAHLPQRIRVRVCVLVGVSPASVRLLLRCVRARARACVYELVRSAAACVRGRACVLLRVGAAAHRRMQLVRPLDSALTQKSPA